MQAPAKATPSKSLGDKLELDEIHVEFSPDLVQMAMDEATGLDARIDNMRDHVASVFGLIVPEIRITDNAILPSGTYTIKIHGVEQARDQLFPNQVLVLLTDRDPTSENGRLVKEPVYGAPARWIESDMQEQAALQGLTVVLPAEVLATHLLEVIKRNFGRLLTFRSLRKILDEFTNLTDQSRSELNQRMLDELIPDKVPVEILLAVMRQLLDERVSIRNLPLILEATSEARGRYSTTDEMAEFVRHKLGFQIIAELRRPDGSLPLIQLAPEWETLFQQYAIESERGLQDIALPPDEFNRLGDSVAKRIAKAAENGTYPAIVTSTRRRRFLRTVLSAKGITNPVYSFDEIGVSAKPSLVGVA